MAIQIDWASVDGYLEAGNSAERIAAAIGVSHCTLRRAVKKKFKITFEQYKANKVALGDDKLIHKGYNMALQGNKTMLIFYLKNRCGFVDRKIVEHDLGQEVEKSIAELVTALKAPINWDDGDEDQPS